jgi:hypothetical protein
MQRYANEVSSMRLTQDMHQSMTVAVFIYASRRRVEARSAR